MPRATFRATLAAAILAIGGTGFALAQGMHHGGHRGPPPAAGQAPPSAEEMGQMMHMMQRLTPEQMEQLYGAMRQRMTPEMHGQMMGRMGHGGMPHGDAHARPGGRAHDHGAAPEPGAAASPSTAAFQAANERMHREMTVRMTGDADRDFAAMMIPHHQGAIDMARIQLQFGRDPELRRLAEAVIREQEREIAELRAFLQRAGGR